MLGRLAPIVVLLSILAGGRAMADDPPIGTVFHDQLPDGSLPKATRMKFAPNSGYAFAVHNDTWHSADKVRSDVKSRDSILLTYFVDSGPLLFLRNRSRRVGNCLLNEVRYRFHRH